jgi:hypothetical protein
MNYTITDEALAALKAAAKGTPPNSAENAAVEVAIAARREEQFRARQARREIESAARNAAFKA